MIREISGNDGTDEKRVYKERRKRVTKDVQSFQRQSMDTWSTRSRISSVRPWFQYWVPM